MPDDSPSLDAAVTCFSHDETGYSRWLDEHPAGYILNCEHVPSSRYLVLHRASCSTISGAPARGTTWTSAYAKVCSKSASDLDNWAKRRTGALPSRCGQCHP